MPRILRMHIYFLILKINNLKKRILLKTYIEDSNSNTADDLIKTSFFFE